MGSSRWRPPLGKRRVARLIAVGAAGPGVGKSVVASNLAVALAGLGPHVVLVDLDLAAARQQALFGIKRAAPRRAGLARSQDRDARVVAHVDGHSQPPPRDGRDARAGARALPAELRSARSSIELAQLDGDVVVVDVGTANREDLLDFFSTRALRVLVSGPEPDAIETSFAFLKSAAAARGDAVRRRRARGARALPRPPRGQQHAHARGGRVVPRVLAPRARPPRHPAARARAACAAAIASRSRSTAQRPAARAARARRERARVPRMAEALMMEGVVSDDACELGTDEPPTVAQGPLPVDLRSLRAPAPALPGRLGRAPRARRPPHRRARARRVVHGRRHRGRSASCARATAARCASSSSRASRRSRSWSRTSCRACAASACRSRRRARSRRASSPRPAPSRPPTRPRAKRAASPRPRAPRRLDSRERGGDAGGDGSPRPRRLLLATLPRLARAARVPHADRRAGRRPRRGRR